ncbi:MAG: CRTAC1 family protein [Luteitalea sp.]|nr:CRTAC1 family protein [Luteitalea sp.]
MSSRFRCLLFTVVFVGAAGLPALGQGMATSGRAVPSGVVVDATDSPFDVRFVDIAVEAGLTARNVSGNPSRKQYIVEAVGNGVALFDYDNDGRLDIFLANGSTLDNSVDAAAETHRLYRNLGNLRFQDVTHAAGLERTGWGQGACVGDYDNDGWRDLFVTFWGQSVLYRNDGDGTFTDITTTAGLSSEGVRWDTGCTFIDYDVDGDLDLAVSGYVDFDLDEVPSPGSGGYCRWKGLPVMCGPRGLPPGRNLLLQNDGRGHFRDVSKASGIGEQKRCYGFTVLASDLDNDAFPDLYVACDSTPSLFYRNLGDGSFEEIGVLAGVALNENGQEQAGMGVATADVDEDGFVDIVKTNFSDDTPNLYHNDGNATFSDQVYVSGLGIHTQYLGWGAHLFDADHDGRRDILLVNGHVYPEVDNAGLAVTYRQKRLLYQNVRGRFADVSDKAGPGIATAAWSSRGSAVGDLDNDGSLEVVINNMSERPSLLKNQGKPKNWLMVRLVGTRANRDALGARAYVVTAEGRISGEVQGGSGYLSQSDSRLHFGLGGAERCERIEVLWPGGEREVFEGSKANRLVVLKQGEGEPAGPSKSR